MRDTTYNKSNLSRSKYIFYKKKLGHFDDVSFGERSVIIMGFITN